MLYHEPKFKGIKNTFLQWFTVASLPLFSLLVIIQLRSPWHVSDIIKISESVSYGTFILKVVINIKQKTKFYKSKRNGFEAKEDHKVVDFVYISTTFQYLPIFSSDNTNI